jgi:hypothetical protein
MEDGFYQMNLVNFLKQNIMDIKKSGAKRDRVSAHIFKFEKAVDVSTYW